ncbi:hypothetical protein A7A08_02834 [Methyloligella halotolerans]|uniref:Uncharacterized protein n=1 Tax=Methyloligella halotolerans TaxID=1177755 RepID=A0A1E2RVC1_9HYPH|nr:hypothetical protein A7A08_02834 [Methyloligella halotolerans]
MAEEKEPGTGSNIVGYAVPILGIILGLIAIGMASGSIF